MRLLPLFALLASAAANRADDDWYVARNRATVEAIYNLTVFPNNVPILQHLAAAIPPGIFNDSVVGRVTPAGAFVGLDDSLEYFFGLSVPVPPAYTGFSKSNVVQFTSGCPEVAASTVYLETSAFDPVNPRYNISYLKEFAFWRFDETGAVLAYDAWLPNLSAWIADVAGTDIYAPAVQAGSIYGICAGVQDRCTGPNQQYGSVEECIGVLSQKTYGNYDETWGDNVVCRSIHLLLTASRPDVHCPHVGPTGGGKCVDGSYVEKYFGDQALFGKTSLELFNCPEKSPAKSDKHSKKKYGY
ncbi:hypothetical protein EJ06DRAFT_472523 [Trichodelitschia bisporula]|uniref:Uncharacterized protein n=1 Tax=Trichodelitschia bisporula TaxID=703511 RepID=A0A6G1I4Q2_9PEZI|nr:hypothetical protein EJ06DRAFT_472523 [Trichodelitschia bisporula]